MTFSTVHLELLLGLIVGIYLVNFFVKSNIVLPCIGLFLSIAGIIIMSDSGMSGNGDQWLQYAFIVPCIALGYQVAIGFYCFIKY